MSKPTVEFFYDYSSPWTYLAFTRIDDLCRERGAQVAWKPILVGGIFNSINPSVYDSRENPVPAKARYMLKDLGDWARRHEVEIRFPPTVFPVNSVKALRGALVAIEKECIVPYSERIFRAYWGEDLDISRDDVLEPLVREVGLDPAAFFSEITKPERKARVREYTEECVQRGGFGSPTLFLGEDMYFGNDRLVLLEAALDRLR